MDLVIAGDDLAARIDHEGAVSRFFGRHLDGERTDMQMDFQIARKLAEGGEANVLLLFRDGGEQILARQLHDVGHLGCLHVLRARRRGLANERRRRIEIVLRLSPGTHLHQAGKKLAATVIGRPIHAAEPGCASSGSSLPESSSA
jgi:hypothetical protein